jgi:hypothetical protein
VLAWHVLLYDLTHQLHGLVPSFISVSGLQNIKLLHGFLIKYVIHCVGMKEKTI